MQSPPFPHYLVPPRYKHSPQHHVLKHPQLPFLPQCKRPSFTPIQNNRQNYSSVNFVSYLHRFSEKAARNCGKESCVTKEKAHLRPRTSLSLLLWFPKKTGRCLGAKGWRWILISTLSKHVPSVCRYILSSGPTTKMDQHCSPKISHIRWEPTTKARPTLKKLNLHSNTRKKKKVVIRT